jgi:hypothetical protein
MGGSCQSNSYNGGSTTKTIGPASSVTYDESCVEGTYAGVRISPPDSLQDGGATPTLLAKHPDYTSTFQDLDQQGLDTASEVETFTANSYQAVQNGQVTVDDLVDPYLGAREYSPEEQSQTWALRSLTALGASPPNDIDQVGYMNVTDPETGSTYRGVIMADQAPAGGFQQGTVYNTSELNNTAWLATNDGPVELDEFRIDSVEHPNGTQWDGNRTVEMQETQFNTTDLSGFQERQELMKEVRVEIDTRQQRIGNGSGLGGWWPENAPNIPFGGAGVAGILIGFVIVLLLLAALN